MRNNSLSKAKRIAAGFLCLWLLVLVLFSSFYPAAEADHDCAGDDCAICVCIRLCESILSRSGGILVLLAAVVPVLFFFAAISSLSVAFPLETLISKKVRLNN